MNRSKASWLFLLGGIVLFVFVPLALFLPKARAAGDPWSHVPQRPAPTDHTNLLPGPYETPQDVTRACLECHPNAAQEVMQTSHWTWLSEPMKAAWLGGREIQIGKKNAINNFCIGIQGNWPGCTKCHIGYGWSDANFDFQEEANVDCLACHADMTLYGKGKAGLPADGVDLTAAAQSVGGPPTRENCGRCHFNGGGGNAVKHGDLDESLYEPDPELDVHMGKYDLQCVDCHTTEHHRIKGQALSFAVEKHAQVACEDCHGERPHSDDRLNDHTDTVACSACHVPYSARKWPTKVWWDWSTAGRDDIPQNHYTYLKIKGSFRYEKNIVPEYYWWNGTVSYRYLLGDEIDPDKPTLINPPAGDIHDPNAKIWPFKIHRGRQPYDTQYRILLQPWTVGKGAFWDAFDWQVALEKGAEFAGIPFSGEWDFAETWFFYPQAHMVAPADQALQCTDCHGPNGRLDWQALGYPGDPAEWGGRESSSK